MLSGVSLLVLIFLAILFIILASSIWKMHPFLALFMASLGLGLCSGMALPEIILAINNGFGNIMGYIGLIVVMGSIIGIILEKSGAALTIANFILNRIGKKRPTLAMSLIGAIVSIPVFCDSGFIILSGLNKAIAKKANVANASLALALAAGLYTTHTLIPPTPGPITAAGNLGASEYIGTIMLLGFVLSIPSLLVAWLFSNRKGAKIETALSSTTVEYPSQLPQLLPSILPILLPILLIALGSLSNFLEWEGSFVAWIQFLGHPLIALFIGMLYICSRLYKKRLYLLGTKCL